MEKKTLNAFYLILDEKQKAKHEHLRYFKRFFFSILL